MMRWDLDHYLPGDILAKVDRASMAVSLEAREPLLDHRIVELAFNLPLRLRIGARGGKHILRRILDRHVPRAWTDRRKQGFAIPIREWMRGPLSELLEERLSPERVRADGLFDPALVARTLADFRGGSGIDPGKPWLLLAFSLWKEAWMDGGAGAAAGVDAAGGEPRQAREAVIAP